MDCGCEGHVGIQSGVQGVDSSRSPAPTVLPLSCSALHDGSFSRLLSAESAVAVSTRARGRPGRAASRRAQNVAGCRSRRARPCRLRHAGDVRRDAHALGADHKGCVAGSGSGSVTSSTASLELAAVERGEQVAPLPAVARARRAPALAPRGSAREQRLSFRKPRVASVNGSRHTRMSVRARKCVAVRRRRHGSARRRAHGANGSSRRSRSRASTSCDSTAWPSEPRPSTPTRRFGRRPHLQRLPFAALLRPPVGGHVAMQVEHRVRHVLDHAVHDARLDHAHDRQPRRQRRRSRTGRRRRPTRTAASGSGTASAGRRRLPRGQIHARRPDRRPRATAGSRCPALRARKISAHCRPRCVRLVDESRRASAERLRDDGEQRAHAGACASGAPRSIVVGASTRSRPSVSTHSARPLSKSMSMRVKRPAFRPGQVRDQRLRAFGVGRHHRADRMTATEAAQHREAARRSPRCRARRVASASRNSSSISAFARHAARLRRRVRCSAWRSLWVAGRKRQPAASAIGGDGSAMP